MKLVSLSTAPGQQLEADAAASWDRVAREVQRRYGWLPVLTDSVRPESVQQRIFLERYEPRRAGAGPFGDVRTWRGVRYVRVRGAAAAVPGTSRHGLGLAVDCTGLGGFTGTKYRQLMAVQQDHGWSNTVGRTINEAWHQEYTRINDRHLGSGVGGGSAVAPAPTTPPLPAHLQEAIMAGPIRMKIGKSITLVDVSVGTDIGVPNSEYDQALQRIKIPLEVVTERERDLIKDMCSRVRDQRNKEIAANVKAAR